MKRLLRILFTVRGLILAGTLALAIFGSYLVRGAAPSATEMKSHPASHVYVLGGSQSTPQWRVGDPCPPTSTPESAPACW
jgi:hypothetical protein